MPLAKKRNASTAAGIPFRSPSTTHTNSGELDDIWCATTTVIVTASEKANHAIEGRRDKSGAPNAQRSDGPVGYAISKRATVPFTSVIDGRSPSSAKFWSASSLWSLGWGLVVIITPKDTPV